MGKHPVSTTIDIELNKELDDTCKGKCSKYVFIREAIKEKLEKTKNEQREKTERRDSGKASADGKGYPRTQETDDLDT